MRAATLPGNDQGHSRIAYSPGLIDYSWSGDGGAARLRLDVAPAVALADQPVRTAGEVSFTELTPTADGVRGMLVLPPPEVPRRSGVLWVGGSEGGVGGLYDAPTFAAELLLALGGPPHRALFYPDAGHGVGTFPYLPSKTVHQGRTGEQTHGGTRAGDAAARRDGWSEVLTFLAAR